MRRRSGLCPSRLPASGPRAGDSLASDRAQEVGSETGLPLVVPPHRRLFLGKFLPLAKEVTAVFLAIQFSIFKAEKA